MPNNATKLEQEPRLNGESSALVEWARRVVGALNACVGFLNQWTTQNSAALNFSSIVSPTGSAFLGVDCGPSPSAAGINGYRLGAIRWQMMMPNATAEGGSNTGSDFMISRFTDAQAYIDTPFSITRSSGLATFNGPATFNGIVSQPTKPVFFASGVNAATSGSVIIFQSPQVNVGGSYNASNGRFTAPIAGVYFFRANVMYQGAAGELRLQMTKNGAVIAGTGTIVAIPASTFGEGFTACHVSMAAGDYVSVILASSPGSPYYPDGTWHSFSGHLVA